MKLLGIWNTAALGAVLACGISAFGETLSSPANSTGRPAVTRIMPVGDSITAGWTNFVCYRPLLAEKLLNAGYKVEFVGSKISDSPIGELRHEGYGGMTVEFLAETVPANFKRYPADIVLLLAGGNHTVEEDPVPGMIAATERLISSFREINPEVTVLLAQFMENGKQPKYSYIPAFNREIARLAQKLDSSSQRVILVDLTVGYDWRNDTVSDHVHTNAQGAEKVAEHWFKALKVVLGPP